MAMGDQPLVSVVTATYNRSNVLRHAIESVLRQTVSRWELIVVGDACTDDTAEVVASFEDSRIQFHNLASNVGEQSGPNNHGAGLATGKYLAYLNHDDIWLPEHLAVTTSGIEESNADLVFSAALGIGSEGNWILSAMPGGVYSPHVPVPASCWLMRRSLIEEVGPWRYFREIYTVPSQDFLLRAWRAGHHLEPLPEITLAIFQSGSKVDSYAHRLEDDHLEFLNGLAHEPGFLQQAFAQAAIAMAAERHEMGLIQPVERFAKNAVLRVCGLLGISPQRLRSRVVHRRKGRAIDKLRKVRGLEPLPPISSDSAGNKN